MKQYGLQIEDNRYSFTTYDKYVRKPIIAKNSLLIIDEAHNFRTEIQTRKMAEEGERETTEEAILNKKGFAIFPKISIPTNLILELIFPAQVEK